MKKPGELKLNTGAKIPLMGLGVWRLSTAQAKQSVEWAIKTGYRMIDTAKIYGNESGVGDGVRASGKKREEIFVTSKLWGDDIFNPEKGIEGTLKRLGFDYIDLYLIHWPFPFWQGAWKKMEKIIRNGKAKAIGVSNFSKTQIEAAIKINGIVPSVNQIEISPFGHPKDLIDFCQDKGIAVEAYTPLTKGRRLNDTTVAGIAGKYKKTAAQIMIRWGLQHELIELPRSALKEHVEENFGVWDFEISAADMKRLDNLDEGYRASW